MALHHLKHLQLLTPPRFSKSLSVVRSADARGAKGSSKHRTDPFALRVRCYSVLEKYNPTVTTRSENYQYEPTVWDYDFVESLKSTYGDGTYMNRMEKLKKEVKELLEKTVGQLSQLELIDVLQRLGVSYLFQEEITRSLTSIYGEEHMKKWMKDHNLYATALSFRLFRQYGFQVVQDMFTIYKDKNGNFKESLCGDVKGMLSLYEAAHLGSQGETILGEAIVFTQIHLNDLTNGKIADTNLAKQVIRSLERPLHWRMQRSEARWYMDEYEKEKDMNPSLLELAKLNFNMVQATHQQDLRNMSRWWRSLNLKRNINFARDRLVESYLVGMGSTVEPQYTRCREWLTKVVNLVLIVDDVYDIYGSLEELVLFTDAVERWDAKAMKKLPYYMKLCLLAIYNTTNEMAFEVLGEQGRDILPYLTKSWADFLRAMEVEANWCSKGYTPSLKEYLDNGWVSSSTSMLLVHAFFATKQEMTNEELQGLDTVHDLLRLSSLIVRLSNDLATYSSELERGDVASSIYCYMKETNCTEKEARKHIQNLLKERLSKINGSICDAPFDLPFINIALNLARTVMFIYQYGDGIGVEASKSKDRLLSLIVNPVEIKNYPLKNFEIKAMAGKSDTSSSSKYYPK